MTITAFEILVLNLNVEILTLQIIILGDEVCWREMGEGGTFMSRPNAIHWGTQLTFQPFYQLK